MWKWKNENWYQMLWVPLWAWGCTGRQEDLQPGHGPSHVTKKWVRDRRSQHLCHGGKASQTSTGFMICTRTVLRVFCGVQQGAPGTAICAIPLFSGIAEKAFLCPDCMEPVEMEISEDGTRYTVNADQFSFRRTQKEPQMPPLRRSSGHR